MAWRSILNAAVVKACWLVVKDVGRDGLKATRDTLSGGALEIYFTIPTPQATWLVLLLLFSPLAAAKSVPELVGTRQLMCI
ncbi:hypothetical protein B0T26DRAFT_385829 [Lasiosphaeria miniovina]|uniref:Uncharacterized protein n=1 Tax=Lasiosphaeria miniovina TaxID=1954250 RepID=A0AA40DUQ7_9PEZI|nr:uncharacterized protein B0T26DRAFT_385829 [Lasiosphaeria miniovina]KAK0714142.1 hypothetical protein B0T26DRAFT_385829 [Lasiosphaeria miniovina]